MSDANRIGSKCWYQTKYKDEWMPGTLRAWGTDHEEFETGPGNFPVAVVEDERTLKVEVVYAAFVCFATVPPIE